MGFRHTKKHMIDFIFPLTLLLVFALSAMIVLLLSARIYSAQASRSEYNYQSTTPLAYIAEKFHANDSEETILIKRKEGRQCLVFQQKGYATYLYTDNGWLKELVVKDHVSVPLKSGKNVIEAKNLSVTLTSNGLYRVTVTKKDGTRLTRLLAGRSRS